VQKIEEPLIAIADFVFRFTYLRARWQIFDGCVEAVS